MYSIFFMGWCYVADRGWCQANVQKVSLFFNTQEGGEVQKWTKGGKFSRVRDLLL